LWFNVAAFGCEDPVLPDDVSWFKRSGDTATVGCHSDDVTDTDESTYTLTCVSGRWVGPTQLCSTMSGNVNVALALDRGGVHPS